MGSLYLFFPLNHYVHVLTCNHLSFDIGFLPIICFSFVNYSNPLLVLLCSVTISSLSLHYLSSTSSILRAKSILMSSVPLLSYIFLFIYSLLLLPFEGKALCNVTNFPVLLRKFLGSSPFQWSRCPK